MCKKIDHFPEDADYEQDTAEYLLRESASLCTSELRARSLGTPLSPFPSPGTWSFTQHVPPHCWQAADGLQPPRLPAQQR